MGAGYFLTAKLGLKLAFLHPSATPVWAPTGIALASVLLLGRRAWPSIFLGAFLVNLTTYGTMWMSLGIATGNTLEGLVGAYLVSTYARGTDAFDRPQDFFKFAVLGAVISTALSATIGVTSLALGGFARWAVYGPIWLTWWLGDVAGALIAAPLIILWSKHPDLRWDGRAILERAVFLAVLFLAAWIVFGGLFPFAYLTVPFLVWAAFRFDQRETATVIVLLAIPAIWGTVRGLGPFVGTTPNESLLMLQAFMVIMAIVSLPLASVVAERQRLREAAERAAARANRLHEVTLVTLTAIVSSAVSARDASSLLESTLDLTLRAMGCENGGIWAGSARAVRGLPPEVGHSMLGAAESTGHDLAGPEAVNDWHTRTGLRTTAAARVMDQCGIRASIAAPVQTEGRVVGAVAVVSERPRTWSAEEVLLVTAIGKQIGGAVERLQFFQATQRRTTELEAFYTLSRRLREAHSLGEMYPIIVGHAMQLLATDHGVLALLDEDRTSFTRVYTAGIPPEEPGSIFPVAGSRSGRVVKTSSTFVTEDFNTESMPEWQDSSRYSGLGPLVIVPLRSEEEIIGTLRLARGKTRDPFSDFEVRLLEGIAEIAATAIRRVRLHHNLEQSYIEMVLVLARAADVRDSYTADHSDRIAMRAVAIARALGCTESDLQDVHWAALLHDIGKLGVPDKVLQKPGPLTQGEWAIMRQHPLNGWEILRPITRMQHVAVLVRHHQERWDGTGYPDRLRGEAIPLGARILAVADAYGAITDNRIYRRARTARAAIAEIRRCAGTQFDPSVVEAFCRTVTEERASRPAPNGQTSPSRRRAIRPSRTVRA